MGFQKRLSGARKLMGVHGFDSFMLTAREDIFYYTGYKASDGNTLLIQKYGKPLLFVSPLENDAESCRTTQTVYLKSIDSLTKPLKGGLVGFDEFSLSANRFLNLHKHHARLKKASALIKKPMEIKDEEEIEHMKKAISITKKSLEATKIYGKKEIDVARKIEVGFRVNGGETAFDTIVANGTASIHHMPGNSKVRRDKTTIVDLGARYNWYCSDITRTYLGSSGWKSVWEDVKEMQEQIIEAIRPGKTMDDLQKLYQSLMAKKKYKVYHSFGHGIGLVVHEQVTGLLKENMVITAEPGVYLKHRGGVRIEDMVLVRKGKPLVLSKSIKY